MQDLKQSQWPWYKNVQLSRSHTENWRECLRRSTGGPVCKTLGWLLCPHYKTIMHACKQICIHPWKTDNPFYHIPSRMFFTFFKGWGRNRAPEHCTNFCENNTWDVAAKLNGRLETASKEILVIFPMYISNTALHHTSQITDDCRNLWKVWKEENYQLILYKTLSIQIAKENIKNLEVNCRMVKWCEVMGSVLWQTGLPSTGR